MALHIGESLRRHPCRNNGVVVGHLRAVKHLLRLGQLRSCQRLCILLIPLQSVEDSGTLRVDVITKILRIYTWISGVFAFIERLDDVQRLLSAHAKLPVAVHLQ